jgi:hypothetical protein
MNRHHLFTIGCAAAAGFVGLELSSARANVSASTVSSASLTITAPASIDSQQGLVEGALPITSTTALVTQISKKASPILAAPRPSQRATIPPAVSRLESAIAPRDLSQANFTITGDQDQSISVSVPTELALIRIGGNETVTFTTTSDLPDETAGQRLAGGDGILAFNVGGRVAEGGDRVPGRYSGILRVTAQYN